ncbi:MAG TPA: RHS repeat-associated core domain-containing protein [Candidatus Acidoferrales bacterium]|nr:RHS repeat-associated core domain-containing protein [Candidatus Acidoferrales bacterium]
MSNERINQNRKTSPPATAQQVTAGSGPTNSVSVDSTTNRINSPGYSYDAAGNLTNDGMNSLVYDAEDRATSSTGSLGSGAYAYDGYGQRIAKTVGGATTDYIFSNSQVIAEYTAGAAASSPSREYIYSGGALVAKIEGVATQYYLHDLLSPRVTAASNFGTVTILGHQGHYPFGEQWYAANTTTKWGYTTYERDSESGNDYATARYYVNRLGRFNALDPVGGSADDPQSLDLYTYVRNDAENMLDPSGQQAMQMGLGSPLGNTNWYMFGNDPASLFNQLDIRVRFVDNFNISPHMTNAAYWEYLGDPQTSLVLNSEGYFVLRASTTVLTGSLLSVASWWRRTVTFVTSVPWQLNVSEFFPIFRFPVGPGPVMTFGYIPYSRTLCLGGGIGAGTIGKTVNGGPLMYGNLSKAKSILSGPSISFGAQPTPFVGVQGTSNSSGLLGGPTVGTPGYSISATYSKCF